MACYAVIDTNVIIAALLSKKNDTATVQVFRVMLDGRILPLCLVTGSQKHYPIKDFIVTP